QPAAAAGDEKTLSRQLESVEDAHRSARLRWGDHHAGMFINLPAERSARWKITPPPRGLRTARRTSPGSPAIYHAPGPPDAPAKNLPRIGPRGENRGGTTGDETTRGTGPARGAVMLTILGRPQRTCTGPTRRELLQAGGAGLFGLSLPKVLAGEAERPAGRARAKSVLFVFLFGGPSQLETFDLKPDAPSGSRGPFRPIASRTPGLRVSEHLPRLAALSDRFAVVRTVTHRHNDHNACHYIQTGHPMPPASRGAAG